MADALTKIKAFLDEHHVLTLATSRDNTPQCCNLFYTYLEQDIAFVVASDQNTEHIANVLNNPSVAGTVVLETNRVGKIQGLQFKGHMHQAEEAAEVAYFRAFPYAKAMNPVLWQITLEQMKLTDNRLGFGKKLLWERKEG